jgi:hypothetical protein
VNSYRDWYGENVRAAAKVDMKNDEFAQAMRADRAVAARHGIDYDRSWVDGDHKVAVLQHAEKVDAAITRKQSGADLFSDEAGQRYRSFDPATEGLIEARHATNGGLQYRANRDQYAASLRGAEFQGNPYAAQLSRSVRAGQSGLINLAKYAQDSVNGNPYQEVADDSLGAATASTLKTFDRTSQVVRGAGLNPTGIHGVPTEPLFQAPADNSVREDAAKVSPSLMDRARSAMSSAASAVSSVVSKTATTVAEKARGLWGRMKAGASNLFGREVEA